MCSHPTTVLFPTFLLLRGKWGDHRAAGGRRAQRSARSCRAPRGLFRGHRPSQRGTPRRKLFSWRVGRIQRCFRIPRLFFHGGRFNTDHPSWMENRRIEVKQRRLRIAKEVSVSREGNCLPKVRKGCRSCLPWRGQHARQAPRRGTGAGNPKAELPTLSGAPRPRGLPKRADSGSAGWGVSSQAPGDAQAAGAPTHLEKCPDTGCVLRPHRSA